MSRIVIEKEVEVSRYVKVDVDVTNEVEHRADKLAREVLAKRTLGIAPLDLDAATLGVLRLHRRGTATHATITNLLLDLIGSDHLRREVGSALRGREGWES